MKDGHGDELSSRSLRMGRASGHPRAIIHRYVMPVAVVDDAGASRARVSERCHWHRNKLNTKSLQTRILLILIRCANRVHRYSTRRRT